VYIRIPFADSHTNIIVGFMLGRECYIHIGVGFSVARSTISGNARASKCGTGDRTVPTLFLYAVGVFTNQNFRTWGQRA